MSDPENGAIRATDGNIGHVKDFYFDDEACNPESTLIMKLSNFLSAALLLGGAVLATSALAQSQGGHGSSSSMMGGSAAGWMGGGYGGILIPVLLIVVIAGFVAWIVAKKRK